MDGFVKEEKSGGPKRKRRKLNGTRETDASTFTEEDAVGNRTSYTALMDAFGDQPANPSLPKDKQPDIDAHQAGHTKTGLDAEDNIVSKESEVEDEAGGSLIGADDAGLEFDEDQEAVDDLDSDDEDQEDPFEKHLNSAHEYEVEQAIKQVDKGEWTTARVQLGVLRHCHASSVAARPVLMPQEAPESAKEWPFLKRRVLDASTKALTQFNELEQGLGVALAQYHDVLFGGRTVDNASSLRKISVLHALNHVHKTRDRILKNNSRLATNADLELRDQGFTRPKILFLLETRQNCARYAETIIELSGAEQVENKKRLFDAFSSDDKHPEGMPEDFRDLFDGNDDNVFRVGLKITRKTLKLFSKFYASDIILASPLGLRLAIEGKGVKHRDSDFLSSIEMVIMDQADAMLMQNWEHVDYVFEHLDLQPTESHGCDYSRIRHWYLDGHASCFRQTIVFSSYLTPTLLGLYSKQMRNVSGKIKYQPHHNGIIIDPSTRILSIKQTFSRFVAASPSADPDARFQYFVTAVLPSLIRIPKPSNGGGQGILIFVPSHADFSRLHNHFATSTQATNVSFGAISESTKQSDVRRARSHFERGRHSMLLYSGRAHHFRRFRIKGVKKVVCYGLPDNPVFYQELVGGFLSRSAADGLLLPNEAAVRAMFSKWDLLALERIVGTEKVAAMVKQESRGDTFDFV